MLADQCTSSRKVAIRPRQDIDRPLVLRARPMTPLASTTYRNACVVDVWVARGRRTDGGTRGAVAGTSGAEVRVCAPPDFAELLARVGAPLVPVGQPVRPLVTGATPPSAADLPRRAAELVAAQFDTVAAAAEGCDASVATGVMPTGGCR